MDMALRDGSPVLDLSLFPPPSPILPIPAADLATKSAGLADPESFWLLGVRTGVWGLLSQILLWVLAPNPESIKALAQGADSSAFIDRSDFFDYPDSDQTSLLAVAQFIGEKPVIFVKSGMNQLGKGASLLARAWSRIALDSPCLADSGPGFFHHILVAALVVAFFFLLFQFCTHM
jgi:hypothetical protein